MRKQAKEEILPAFSTHFFQTVLWCGAEGLSIAVRIVLYWVRTWEEGPRMGEGERKLGWEYRDDVTVGMILCIKCPRNWVMCIFQCFFFFFANLEWLQRWFILKQSKMFMEQLTFLWGPSGIKSIDGSWKKLRNLKTGQDSNPSSITHQL